MDALDQLISLALLEDSGFGDITSESIFAPGLQGRGVIVAKEPLVIAGIQVAERVFRTVDPGVQVSSRFTDGEEVADGEIVFTVTGEVISLLKAERVALNFMQRLSGIATLTRKYVKLLERKKVRLTDTRKTTPGWRGLEKAAVRAGGACNHRMSLSDGVLIKDNHIAAAGSLANAVHAVRERISHLMKIEVETSTLGEVRQALDAGVEVIMLDNMSIKDIRKAVSVIKGRAVVEVSGNVCLENLEEIARTGVDVISSGALTHHAQSVDLSMRITH